MYSRDIERLARTFVAQKLDLEYIRHYLVETYQLDLKTADEILAKVAPAAVARNQANTKAAGGDALNPPPIKRQRFY